MSPLLGVLVGLAWAAGVQGRTRVIQPCGGDPQASCWTEAVSFARFAPAPTVDSTEHLLDLRVAWAPDGLWVLVPTLPSGATVELGLCPAGGSAELERCRPARLPGSGLHHLPARLKIGEERSLFLNLVVASSEGRVALPWTPLGPADPARPARVLLGDRGDLALPWSVNTGAEGEIQVDAPGATIELRLEQPSPPQGSRGVPPAWSAVGNGTITVNPPDNSGWVEVLVRWRDGADQVVHLDSRRVRVEVGPPPWKPGASFPPADVETTQAGRPYRLRLRESLCLPAEMEQIGRILRTEWTRLLGVELGESAACGVRVGIRPDLPPETFEIQVSATDIQISAGSPRAALWAGLHIIDRLAARPELAPQQLRDSPRIARRILYHSINTRAAVSWRVADHLAFLERVVSRGRYNEVHLLLGDSVRLEGWEAYAHPRAMSASDLSSLVVGIEAMGLMAVPAVNGPGHSGWITEIHPELMEDVNTSLLDPRHPDTLPLLESWLDSYLALFPQATRVHLGVDEAVWATGRWFEDEANPKNAATHRAILLAEFLEARVAGAQRRGLSVDLWNDLFVQEWNGGRDGATQTLDLLDAKTLGALHLFAWSALGDPVQEFAIQRKIPLSRVHTGYLDWKRAGLAKQAEHLEGEGLGVFVATPWAGFGPPAGSRAAMYHFGSVLLAGLSAWEPDLDAHAIGPWLEALANHPSFLPGFRAPPHGRVQPLGLAGGRPEAGRFLAPLPGGGTPRWAVPGEPVQTVLREHRLVGHVSVELAALLSHSARQVLLADHRTQKAPETRAVAELVWRYPDGEHRIPLEYGLDVGDLVADPRLTSLWRTGGSRTLPSPEAAASGEGGRDRRLWRIVQVNPEPDRPVVGLTVEVKRPGVSILVSDVGVWER